MTSPQIKGFLLAFFVSAALATGSVSFLAWRLGATATIREMAEEQRADPRIVALPPDLKYFGALKMRRLAQEQPEVVAIGSSRCNELRSAMFRPYRFYNACLSAWTFDQMLRTLDLATSMAHPRIVIFTMDYNMFSRGQESYANRIFDMDEGLTLHAANLKSLVARLVDNHPGLLQDLPVLLAGRKLEPTDGLELLGTAANQAEAGFRHDGSFLYPRGMLANAEEANRSPTNDMQPGGRHVEERSLDALARMKAMADDRQAVLVGIQLPLLGSAVDYLDHDRVETSGVWQDFESEDVRRRIREIGVPFFDLARLPLTADHRFFIDPSHPNEAGTLGGLVSLFDNPQFRAIFSRLDAADLRRDYDNAVAEGNLTAIYHGHF